MRGLAQLVAEADVGLKRLQIDPRTSGPAECRALKKSMRKWMRRAWKKDPENAPKRYEYMGYC